MGLWKGVSCLINMHALINLTTKWKTNLNYLRNNLWEIYLRNYLQVMPVNIIRKIISNWMFIIWMNNTGIITINTIKTITVPIISFYLSIYFVAHVFFLCCTTRNRPILPWPPPPPPIPCPSILKKLKPHPPLSGWERGFELCTSY